MNKLKEWTKSLMNIQMKMNDKNKVMTMKAHVDLCALCNKIHNGILSRALQSDEEVLLACMLLRRVEQERDRTRGVLEMAVNV